MERRLTVRGVEHVARPGTQRLDVLPPPTGPITDHTPPALLWWPHPRLCDLLEGLTQVCLGWSLVPAQEMDAALVIEQRKPNALGRAPLAVPRGASGSRGPRPSVALPSAGGTRGPVRPIEAPHHHRTAPHPRRCAPQRPDAPTSGGAHGPVPPRGGRGTASAPPHRASRAPPGLPPVAPRVVCALALKRAPDHTEPSPRTLMGHRSQGAPRAQGPPGAGRCVTRPGAPSNAAHTADNAPPVGAVRHKGHAPQGARSGHPCALDATATRRRPPRLRGCAAWARALATAQATAQSARGGRRAVSATGGWHGPRITREPRRRPAEILGHRGRGALFPMRERVPWGRKNHRMLLTKATASGGVVRRSSGTKPMKRRAQSCSA